MYLGWFDDSKKAIADKIAQGRAAYVARFGTPPAFVLMNEEEARGIHVEGIGVLVKPWMRKSNYLFGQSDC